MIYHLGTLFAGERSPLLFLGDISNHLNVRFDHKMQHLAYSKSNLSPVFHSGWVSKVSSAKSVGHNTTCTAHWSFCCAEKCRMRFFPKPSPQLTCHTHLEYPTLAAAAACGCCCWCSLMEVWQIRVLRSVIQNSYVQKLPHNCST